MSGNENETKSPFEKKFFCLIILSDFGTGLGCKLQHPLIYEKQKQLK